MITHSSLGTLTLLTSLLSTVALAQTQAPLEHLVGEAYDLDSGQLIYREHHAFEYKDGELSTALVQYRRADGELIGEKTLNFEPDLYLPAFRTSLYEKRYIEGLRHVGDGQVELFRRGPGDDKDDTKRIRRRSQMAGDAGFNTYVFSRFDELLSGEAITFHFAAPNRLMDVKFKAQRIEDGEVEGMPVVRFKVAIASLLSLFLDPLILAYDPETRHLIEYRGLSNVRDESGELYEVRIVYPELIRKPGALARTAPS